MTASRVLITGASSCTGHHLAQLLRAESEVVGCGRSLAEGAADYRQCDVRDARSVTDLLQTVQPDEIYHLAGVADEGDYELNFEVNLIGTLNLLTAASKLEPMPRVLIVGSCAVYPDLKPDEAAMAEDVPPAPESIYAASRVAQEQLAWTFARKHGLPVVTTRTFNLVGPKLADRFSPMALALRLRRQADAGDPELAITNGHFVRDFVDVRDAVVAYRDLLRKGRTGIPYNVGSGIETTILELAEMLARILELPIEVVAGPASGSRRSSIARSIADLTRTRNEIGWQPVIALADSLRDMVMAEASLAGRDGQA